MEFCSQDPLSVSRVHSWPSYHSGNAAKSSFQLLAQGNLGLMCFGSYNCFLSLAHRLDSVFALKGAGKQLTPSLEFLSPGLALVSVLRECVQNSFFLQS